MPTREAIVDSIIPHGVEKPLPVRTVITRSPRPNINQPTSNVEPGVAVPTPAAESVRLSPQLTALARKEQALQRERQAFKAEQEAFKAKIAEADQYSQLKSKIGSKDYSAAEELGLTYDEYTQYKLNQSQDVDPNLQAIKALEAKIEALTKGTEEKATQEYEEVVAAYKTEIAKLVETNSYPKIKKAQAEGHVLQLIQDSWEEDEVHLSVEQAAKEIENAIGEQAKKWAELIEEPKVVEEQTNALPPPRVGPKTLTQSMAASGEVKRPQPSLQHMSEAERYAEARRRVMARRQGV